MPLHDAKMAQVLGADACIHQGLNPFEAGYAEQCCIGQAAQAGHNTYVLLHRSAGQSDECVNTDMPGCAHAIGQSEKNQPAKQGLGQGSAPSHRLSHPHDFVANGEQRDACTWPTIGKPVEKAVEIVEDHVNERDQGHGGQKEDDKAFLEVFPDSPKRFHGWLLTPSDDWQAPRQHLPCDH
ncbi:hypothetical protein D9M69_438610 [compost metagenome]